MPSVCRGSLKHITRLGPWAIYIQNGDPSTLDAIVLRAFEYLLSINFLE